MQRKGMVIFMRYSMILLLLVVTLMILGAACGSDAEQTQMGMTALTEAEALPSEENKDSKAMGAPAENQPVQQDPDPEGAMQAIYTSLDKDMGLRIADEKDMEEVMGFDLEAIDEYYVRYMTSDFGASDVYIIKPKEDMTDAVREDLKEWQEHRIREFMEYDIYNSTEISENAVIFTRGEYLVMLMLEDNDAARAIVEEYIPEVLDISK